MQQFSIRWRSAEEGHFAFLWLFWWLFVLRYLEGPTPTQRRLSILQRDGICEILSFKLWGALSHPPALRSTQARFTGLIRWKPKFASGGHVNERYAL